ncbi:MAG TPA: DUF3311 domain-containing protein [Rhizomicrobium sp.]|jgi:hypothetical protein|nr:DUF3311 domain-containing protein [Rhizomicrobium sp.]
MAGKPAKGRGFHPIHLLLLLPFIAVLWVPSYNSVEPSLAGIPFFYWYQLLWIPLGALILLPVYLVEERRAKKDDAP